MPAVAVRQRGFRLDLRSPVIAKATGGAPARPRALLMSPSMYSL